MIFWCRRLITQAFLLLKSGLSFRFHLELLLSHRDCPQL